MEINLLCSLVNLPISSCVFFPLCLSQKWQMNVLIGIDLPSANALNVSNAFCSWHHVKFITSKNCDTVQTK